MKYWQSNPWMAKVFSTNESGVPIELAHPWALIGWDAVCDVRIKKSQAHAKSYVAFAFSDTIEVWPLCAQAYSHWGVVNVGQRLRVGHCYVELSFVDRQLDSERSIHQPKFPDDSILPIIEVTHRSKKVNMQMQHRVAILGSEHPSTQRLRNAGLKSFDHAVVAEGDRCWIINLHADPSELKQNAVQLLEVGGASIKIGNLSLAILPPKSKHSSASNVEASGEMHVPTIPPQVSGQPKSIEKCQPKKIQLRGESAYQDLEVAQGIPAYDPASVTSNITDRLMSINRSRWSRRRLIKITLLVILFCAAGSSLLWIAIHHVLPVIMDLEGF